MLEFIFMSILMISLSTVLYLMVRALPRVEEGPAEVNKVSLLDRWAHSELPEKVDAALNGYLLKFLRKLKVIILKLDNTLAHHLQKISRHENNKDKNVMTNIDFSEMGEAAGERRKAAEDAVPAGPAVENKGKVV